MSDLVWRLPGRSTTVTFKGRTAFAQCSPHRVAKSEYGLDSMTVDWIGAAPLLPQFMQGLSQGKRFDHAGRKWFLTTWAPDDNRIWPTVSLSCVGLAEGKLPKATRDNSIVTQGLTVAAIVSEDQGAPTGPVDVVVTRELSYRCHQTAWQYVTEGQPTGPAIGRVAIDADPQILSSVISASGGTTQAVYTGSTAPAAYATATTPAIVDVLLDLNPQEIFGTPYFNVTETVARMFVAL